MLVLVTVWGCNFTAINIALREIPPVLLCALRFALVAFPAVFLLRRPPVALSLLAAYGMLMFATQFSLLFIGMRMGLSPGLASLCLQVQVFITIAFGALMMRERPRPFQIAGAALAAAGLALVGVYLPGEGSVLGFVCVLGAAVAWAAANMLSKRFGQVPMVSLVAWGCLFATPPILCASLLIEGPQLLLHSLRHLSAPTLLSVAFIVYPTTLFGFALWSWQLSRYPVARVAPFTLLVPIAGMACSHMLIGEALAHWKLAAAGLVVLGLCINQFGQVSSGAWPLWLLQRLRR
jgi:O-acetylserine/cysteine efflux transporter